MSALAIQIQDGRYFADWCKFFSKVGKIAQFHPTQPKIYHPTKQRELCEFELKELQKRGYKVAIVEGDYQRKSGTYVFIKKENIHANQNQD